MYIDYRQGNWSEQSATAEFAQEIPREQNRISQDDNYSI